MAFGCCSGAARVRQGRWAALAASVWIQSFSGTSYCFSIYSAALKSSQNYDQSTLDTVGFFKDIGANVGTLSGLLYTYSSTAFPGGGPWVVLAAGAVQCFAGFLPVWLAVVGAVARPPVALMCLYMLVASHGQTFSNTTNAVVGVENFPNNRGLIVGLMKGFLGLSGAILVQVYRTFFNGDPSSFILMLAILPTLVPLLLMYFVRVHPSDGIYDKRLLDAFSLITLIIAGYRMLVIIGENLLVLGSLTRILTLVILLLLLFSPIAIVLKAQSWESKTASETYHHERTRLIDDTDKLEDKKIYQVLPAEKVFISQDTPSKMPCDTENEASSSQVLLPKREDLNLLKAMQTFDFWLLFLAMACGMGTGLATINNLSQIGASLGYPSTATGTLVSLFSIWNFLGRFGSGYISDHFLHLWGCARPLFIALTLAVMSFGHAIIASDLPGALVVGSMVVGVCYGSQWSLMPSITSEIFGIKHFGTIFNTIAIASPMGSYILSVRVVGYIYDAEASSEGTPVCTGKHCFMLSFLVMVCVTLFGSAVALVLFFRTRKFYREVIFARLQASILK